MKTCKQIILLLSRSGKKVQNEPKNVGEIDTWTKFVSGVSCYKDVPLSIAKSGGLIFCVSVLSTANRTVCNCSELQNYTYGIFC